MTIHETLMSVSRQPLMTVGFLLMTIQMALVFAAFKDARKRIIRLLYLLLVFIGVAVFYMLLLDSCWELNFPAEVNRLPYILSAFRSLPVSVIVIHEIMAAVITIAAIWEYFIYRKSHLTPSSIKETMDLLPAGIAAARPDGTVVFSNLTMNGIFRALTGKRVSDLTEFMKTVTEEGVPCDEIDRKIEFQASLPDGSATWQFSSDELDVDGEKYIQLTATDITEQVAISRELEEKNSRLRDIHMRLDIYNKQAERIIIAQELLTARMAVHNEVGNVLLESRHYLADPASFDEELLLQALKNTNTFLLREYEEDDTARDLLVDAVEMAQAIGVDVTIKGVIPAEDPYRRIIASAVSECASNTIKHAKGDRLLVDISSTDTEVTCILQNNGIQPEGPIRENGGLLSLRTLVEQENGMMEISVSEGFRLTIRMSR